MTTINLISNLTNIKNTIMPIISSATFEEFLNDTSGRLILPSTSKSYNNEDLLKYNKLKLNTSVKTMNKNDLPDDFSQKAIALVNEFHQKTIDEEIEGVLYFDYITGEILYCFKGNSESTRGFLDRYQLIDHHVASIHNHTKHIYSFPSPENFDILEKDFENYEIICSTSSFWTIEFKGKIKSKIRRDFIKDCKYNLNYLNSLKEAYNNPNEYNMMVEETMENYFLNEIDTKLKGIDLIINKKEYD